MKPRFSRDYLIQRRAVCFEQMLESLDRFEQSELLFNWRTDTIRARHGLGADEPLSVHAVLDRAKDEQWQNAVADCRYTRDRAIMYATVYRELTERLGLAHEPRTVS